MRYLTALILTSSLLIFTSCEEDDLKAPLPPVLISPANALTDAELDLTFNWDASIDASTYDFQLSLSADFTNTVTNLTDLVALSTTVVGLMPATTYYWRVNAKNSAGISDWSDTRSFLTEPVGIPQLVSPEDNTIFNLTETSVTWSAINDADGYTLQVSTTESFLTTIVNVENLTETTYDITDLDWYTTYYWRVRASIELCNSEWSEVWRFTPELPIPTEGLVAHYPFTGNANDASGNGHHGVVNGSTLASDRNGIANTAYQFDGVDDFIAVSHNSALNLIGEFTISVWYNSDGCSTPCSPPAYHTLINKRDESVAGDNWPWSLAISYIEGPKDEFRKIFASRRDNFNLDYQVSEAEVAINSWQHVVIVLKDNIQSIYIDAELDGTYEFVQNQPVNNESVMIGWSIRPGLEQFKGRIDDIRIYNKALTAFEILALYKE